MTAIFEINKNKLMKLTLLSKIMDYVWMFGVEPFRGKVDALMKNAPFTDVFVSTVTYSSTQIGAVRTSSRPLRVYLTLLH